MNLYAHDLSFYDFGFSDPTIIDSLSRTSSMISSSSTKPPSIGDNYEDYKPPERPKKTTSPPKHRHDGTSPLPLGMDWSHPPRKWDGRNSVWPHDPHTGWSYCVTIPSWIILPKSRGSDPVVFYRLQVAIQSPEGITSTRGILRRFSDFLKLFSELKKTFPKKNLPPAPPKRLLRMKNRMLLEERRCCLENWMEELLSDIDLSRSAPVAIFLELEASARSFYDSNQQVSDVNSSASNMALAYQFQPSSDVYLFGGSSSIASDFGHTSTYEISELGTPSHGRDVYSELGMENTASDQELAGTIEATINDKLSSNVNGQFMGGFIQANQERFSRHKMHFKRDNSAVDRYRVNENSSHTEFHNEDEMELLYEPENHKFRSHVRRLSTGSVGSDVSSVRASETSNSVLANSVCDYSLDLPEGVEASRTVNLLGVSDLQFPSDLLVALPSDERHKMNRVLITMQRRLATAKTDMEDLIARLNQEVAVRQFLTTKVKDLEVELETTKQSGKENLQQAVLIERERFTRMQWDMEELRRKCMEMELNLKSEQDEKVRIESTKVSIIQENDVLQKDLDVAREQLENLQKYFEELELKSKADLKLLVKEVKSLRSSQTDLKQELNRLLKEKLEVERVMQKEKQIGEHANAANAKLLHECEILRNRLEECSVNFLIEEEDKLIMDTSSPSDAIDLLITSDNRIGLLLAEAQLLAQDVESAAAAAAAAAAANSNINGGSVRTRDDDLRKMLADVFVDNARLRKQVNSIVRCALNTPDRSEKDDEEETPPRKTVLSKFLER